MKLKHLITELALIFTLIFLFQCSKPTKPTTEAQPSPGAIPVPTETKQPQAKEQATVPPVRGSKPASVPPKRVAKAEVAQEESALPAVYGGDMVALPPGYGVFIVPEGMVARIYSPSLSLGSRQCGNPIKPPCKLEYPIRGGVMRVELAIEKRSRATKASSKAPQASTEPTWTGLPAEIQSQVSEPLTGAKVRIKRAWARQPLKYYPGERVAGMDIPVGLMLTEHVPHINPMYEPPKCDQRLWAPCLLAMNGKVYVLGKCFNERLEVDPLCEKQMARDLK